MIRRKVMSLLVSVLFVEQSIVLAAQKDFLITWQEPAEDVLVYTRNVLDFGAIADDGRDDTAAFQKAIDAAVADGGGIVYAPAGHYMFSKRLTVRPGITLRGDWKYPERDDAFENITVFEILTGEHDPDGLPFIKMLFGACVRNITFFYPKQSVESPIPYSWTIDSVFNAAVRNVTFINSWQALGHGIITGSGGNLEVQHIYGTPLKTGVCINSGYDFNSVYLVRFNASYWVRYSGLNTEQRKVLKQHLKTKADALVFTYQDGFMMSKVQVEGFRYGLHFDTYNNLSGASVPRRNSCGEIYEISLTDCRQALRVDDLMFVGVTLQRAELQGSEYAVLNRAIGPLLMHSVRLESDRGIAVKQANNGRLSMNQCDIISKSDDAVQLEAGSMNIVRCRILSPKKDVVAADGTGIQLVGNHFSDSKPDLEIRTKNQYVDHHPLAENDILLPPLVWPSDRRPSSERIVNVHSFGAVGNGSIDDSAAVQRALDDSADKGGTVFLPAGEYKISHPLIIPPAVELRGVGDGNARPIEPIDGPDRPRVPGTVLLAQVPISKDVPLITLGAGSGVRGISVVYPDRNSLESNPAYPASIYSSSPDSYVMYTTLCNPYLGIFLENADRHLVKFCRTGSDHLGLHVVGGRNGMIFGFLHHAQYWTLSVPSDWNMPSYVNDSPWHYMTTCADSILLEGCRNEVLFEAGLWEVRNFVKISKGPDGGSASAKMFLSAADCMAEIGFHLDEGVSSFEMYGMHMLTSRPGARAIQAEAGFSGQALFVGNLFRNADLRFFGDGDIDLRSSCFYWDPAMVEIRGGTFNFEDAFTDITEFKTDEEVDLTVTGVWDKNNVIPEAVDWTDAPWSKEFDMEEQQRWQMNQ